MKIVKMFWLFAFLISGGTSYLSTMGDCRQIAKETKGTVSLLATRQDVIKDGGCKIPCELKRLDYKSIGLLLMSHSSRVFPLFLASSIVKRMNKLSAIQIPSEITTPVISVPQILFELAKCVSKDLCRQGKHLEEVAVWTEFQNMIKQFKQFQFFDLKGVLVEKSCKNKDQVCWNCLCFWRCCS